MADTFFKYENSSRHIDFVGVWLNEKIFILLQMFFVYSDQN